MDNTDVKRRVVLVRKTFNSITGERSIHVKPKPVKRTKKIVARGFRSMSPDGVGHTVGDVLTAKALPFRFAMKTLLRRRGYFTTGLSFKFILVKFYNEFCTTKPLDESTFVNNVSFKIKPTDEVTGDVADARNRTAFLEVTALVDAIIETFKKARDKYLLHESTGLNPLELMRDEEVTMARASFKVERSLLAESKKDHYVSSGELNRTVLWLIIFALFIWFLSKI